MKAIPWVLLSAGVILTVTGIMAGDSLTVMRQAVTVCLECIGIG